MATMVPGSTALNVPAKGDKNVAWKLHVSPDFRPIMVACAVETLEPEASKTLR
jgi:hypothetical protein